MGLFDSLKKYSQEKGNSHLTLHACMLGARGVGKTSVLTAIFDDSRSRDGFIGTPIMLQAKAETRKNLAEQKGRLLEVFTHRTDIAAIPPTKGEESFYFELGLVGNNPCIDLVITDYPGEQLVQNPKYVSDKINEAQVVIIAIDAPYVMEYDGAYNEEKNQVTLTTKFITDNIASFNNKLVMLVPLKCEKYLDLYAGEKRNSRADEMAEKVMSIYKEMIDALKEKGDVALMVAPILTVGGVAFDRFEQKEGLHIAKYKFYDGVTPNGEYAQYSPHFCAQPIFHLLSFVAQKYKLHRNNTGLLGSFFKSVSDFFNNNEKFLLEMVKIDRLRIKKGNGYKIICGSDLFYTKND